MISFYKIESVKKLSMKLFAFTLFQQQDIPPLSQSHGLQLQADSEEGDDVAQGLAIETEIRTEGATARFTRAVLVLWHQLLPGCGGLRVQDQPSGRSQSSIGEGVEKIERGPLVWMHGKRPQGGNNAVEVPSGYRLWEGSDHVQAL